MDDKTTTLTGQWSERELRDLATLCDRMGWSDFRSNAVSDSQAYSMRTAVYILKVALADAGYVAR